MSNGGYYTGSKIDNIVFMLLILAVILFTELIFSENKNLVPTYFQNDIL